MGRNCAVIILAAGNSLRMGKPKLLLDMPYGISFLENITLNYANFGCTEIIVVLNSMGIELINKYPQNLPSGIQLILNQNHELGRFYSIKTGLKQINANFVFIHNIDNPYAKKEVLEQIFNDRLNADVIKPVINNKGGHPVLLSKRVYKGILIEKDNNLSLKDFLSRYSSKEVAVFDDSILLNINTNKEFVEFRYGEKR